MPRQPDGTYVLPPGNPVVPQTIIETDWANPTMEDFAVQFNNVLTRDGSLGYTAPAQFVSGTVGAPGYYFGNDKASGMFAAAGLLGLAYGGVQRWQVSLDGTMFNGNVRALTLPVTDNSTLLATTAFVQAVANTIERPNDPSSQFYAYATAPQSFLAGTPDTVNFPLVYRDTQGEYNASTSTFSPKETGYYVFTVGIYAEGSFEFDLYRNNTKLVTMFGIKPSNTDVVDTNASTPPMLLNVGESIHIVLTTFQNYTTVPTQTNMYFSGYRVAGKGPQGATGPQGQTGLQGPQGPEGPQGEDGSSLIIYGTFGRQTTPADLPFDGFIPPNWDGTGYPMQGFQMPIGGGLVYEGISGIGYDQGDCYVYVGVDSPTGWSNIGPIQGAQGPAGPEGPTGATGPQGIQGVEGPQGIQGSQGPQGNQGPQGVQGPQGEQGEQGPAGTTSVLIGNFGAVQVPANLPSSGLIPADWDGPGKPVNDYQMRIGEGLIYQPANTLDPLYNHIYNYVGTVDVPAGWVDVGDISGPPGPEGPQGPVGPTGPQGDQGDQGIQGQQGEEGPTGPAGADGQDGATGPEGPQGIQGQTGQQGPKGDTGDTGPQGPQGIQGEEGPEGPAGESTAVIGDFGAVATPASLPPSGFIPADFDGPGNPVVGYQMLVGQSLIYSLVVNTDPLYNHIFAYATTAIEASGWVDLGASQGPVGPEGPVGPQGPTGATGPQGPQGPQGIQGLQGPQGVEGAEGPAGETGQVGPQGPQGVQGIDGPQGPEGPEGIEGPQGPQGIQGDDGQQGIQGDEGPPGSSAVIISSFTYRTPAELPPSGLIPQDWDGPDEPPAPYQMLIGQALIYDPIDTGLSDAGHLFSYVGTVARPEGWVDAGAIQGPQGETGPEGPQGVQGVQGIQGQTGEQGVAGPEGPEGPQGSQGPTGAQGATGPQGEQGIEGEVGPAGTSAVIVGGFKTITPAQLPPDGFIPTDFDGPGHPVQDYQMVIGQALLDDNPTDSEYGKLFSYVGTAIVPAGWQNVGQIQGPQGSTGQQGPQGPAGAPADLANPGPIGYTVPSPAVSAESILLSGSGLIAGAANFQAYSGSTVLSVIPADDGSRNSFIRAYNNAAASPRAFIALQASETALYIEGAQEGGGYLPIIFYQSGAESARINPDLSWSYKASITVDNRVYAQSFQQTNLTADFDNFYLAVNPSDTNFKLVAANGLAGTSAGTLVARLGVIYAGIGWNPHLEFLRGSGQLDGSINYKGIEVGNAGIPEGPSNSYSAADNGKFIDLQNGVNVPVIPTFAGFAVTLIFIGGTSATLTASGVTLYVAGVGVVSSITITGTAAVTLLYRSETLALATIAGSFTTA